MPVAAAAAVFRYWLTFFLLQTEFVTNSVRFNYHRRIVTDQDRWNNNSGNVRVIKSVRGSELQSMIRIYIMFGPVQPENAVEYG